MENLDATAGCGSGNTNALLNLIKIQDDNGYSIIDKIYLFVKDPNEAEYQYLIEKCKKNGLEDLENLKVLNEFSII